MKIALPPKKDLTALTATMAAEQDRELSRRRGDGARAARQKARLRAALAKRSRPAAAPPFAKRLFFAAVATFAIGLVLFLNARRHRPVVLAFEVDGAPASAGAWVRAPENASATLRFSDASSITLDAAGRARVESVDANGARVALEAGTAHVSITHRDGSKWHVVAGPFDVVVTGTEFDVAWDPASEHFSVHMTRGTVHVLGTLLGAGHPLTTGEAIDVSVPSGVVKVTPARVGTTERTTPAPNDVAAASDAGADIAAPTEPHASRESVHSAPVPEWAVLARNGDYAKAVAAAESIGFDAACDEGRAGDVLALADAARFTAHGADAKTAYEAVRRRFPGRDEAAEAAFDLGRLTFDRDGDFATAAGWFDTYGRERPNGPLAREAAGRLLEARLRSNDASGAKAAASAYLAAYPDGPQAALARSVVGGP